MNKIILGIVAGLLIVGLGVSTLWYHDLYKQTLASQETAYNKIIELEEVIEANNQNTDEQLTKVANQFVTLLFSSDKDLEKRQNSILSLTIKNANKTLEESYKSSQMENMESLEGFTSSVEVKESFYNRVDDNKGVVKIQFEQSLTKDGSTAKTVNEAIIELEYVNDEWKIYEYKINPRI